MNRIQVVRAQRAVERVVRQQAKDAEKQAKVLAKEVAKRQKIANIEMMKQARADQKEFVRRVRLEAFEQIQKEKERKKLMRYEVNKLSISRMIATAMSFESNRFTATQFTTKYIEMHGRVNPYTCEEVQGTYDIHAAIRGLMYETSPSSSQHWFRYGLKKGTEQVAPWIFVNKELAEVNNRFNWMISSPELKKAQKQAKGMWQFLPNGPLTYYMWSNETFGHLPTEEQLENAKQNRKIGVRKSNNNNIREEAV